MAPKINHSYFLYGVGHNPKIATLGTVVLKDYANPNLALSHVCTPLSDVELPAWASTEPVSGTFVSRRSFTPSAGLNLADLVVFDVSWQSKKTQILVAGGGLRQELFDPSQFLATKVLSDPDARRKMTLWVSVARCAHVLKKAAFRRPKIWMLTGLYLLHDVRTYSSERLKTGVLTGISPQISGVAGGPPIGGSLDLGWERGLEADITMPNANVWAAQWRLLDTEYVMKSTVQADGQAKPLRFGLFPDVTSQGVLRGGSGEVAEAWTMRVGPLLHEIDGRIKSEGTEGPGEEPVSEKPSVETYDQWFKEALEWFESEIDDETDDEHE